MVWGIRGRPKLKRPGNRIPAQTAPTHFAPGHGATAGRSSDLWAGAKRLCLPGAASHPHHGGTVRTCAFRSHLPLRDSSGFTPDSLFAPGPKIRVGMNLRYGEYTAAKGGKENEAHKHLNDPQFHEWIINKGHTWPTSV